MEEKLTYAEGTVMEAVVGVAGTVLATAIIAVVVLLTNNGNHPPAW